MNMTLLEGIAVLTIGGLICYELYLYRENGE